MWNESSTTAPSASTLAEAAARLAEAADATAPSSSSQLLSQLSIGVFLLLIIFACVIGNVLVILAVCWERELRARPQCYLIFSLAVADLIVGLIVTPLGAWSTVTGAWTLGVTLCDFWISVDVLVCTASILHLVAIALDRYWSITDICYVQNRTPRRVLVMLAVIWTLSLAISLAPFAGWKDDGFEQRVQVQHVCLISQRISYQVFSTATAFYIPLCAIICVYWKIMRAAKRRFKRERDRRTVHRPPPGGQDAPKKVPLIARQTSLGRMSSAPVQVAGCAPPPPAVLITAESTNGGLSQANSNSSSASDEGLAVPIDATMEYSGRSTANGESETPVDSVVRAANGDGGGRTSSLKSGMVQLAKRQRRRPKESPETKRERKAWRTLAIITGTFVACWTPFFLVSLYRPICRCQIPSLLESITLWLGYLNSALNPIIYTVFSQDFRAAFKKILKRICFINDY